MKRLSNEMGYALFLTILIIMVFSIMAVSLLSFTLSGAKRSSISENRIQAEELSEKGLQHILAEINDQLESELGESGLSVSEFKDKLNEVLDKYKCDINENIIVNDLTTGSYEVCISDYENSMKASGEENELKKIVKFVSTGESNNQNKQREYYVEIGVDSVPDALKYLLSTVEVEGEKKPSDGNIYLHGGIELYGDIKVGNHLFTHVQGPRLLGNHYYWMYTTLPLLYSSTGNSSSNIFLGGKLYQYSDQFYTHKDFDKGSYGENEYIKTSDDFYEDHLDWENSSSFYKESTLNDMFANKDKLPKIVNRDWKGNKVNINERIQEGLSALTPHTKINRDRVRSGLNSDHIIQFTYDKKKESTSIFKGKNKFKGGKITPKYTKNVKFLDGHHKFDSMYIKGNVFIGNLSTSNNPSNYDDITIEGYTENTGARIFVDGDVIIQGANLTSNLTIYTTGTVTVKHSTIQGYKFSDGIDGSLIVFAKGNIHLSNNSRYKNKPSELKGFFYSEDVLEMYGVGSNIKIHGGIAARRITLNAVRGNYLNESSDYADLKNPTNINSPSRLVIQYDTDLIENYLRLNPPEPIVREIDPSKLIDRK